MTRVTLASLRDAVTQSDWDRVRIVAPQTLRNDVGNLHAHLAFRRALRARGYHLSAALHALVASEIEMGAESKELLHNCISNIVSSPQDDPLLPLARAKLWEQYDEIARLTHHARFRSSESERFEQVWYTVGQLPRYMANASASYFLAAPSRVFRSEDAVSFFVSFEFSSEQEAAFNSARKFREIDSAATSIISDVLAAVKDEVAAALGSPWRVLNVRAWSTPLESKPDNMYGWHNLVLGSCSAIPQFLDPASGCRGRAARARVNRNHALPLFDL